MRTKPLFVATALVTALVGAPAPALAATADAWPQYGGSAANDKYQPNPGTLHGGTAPGLRQAWSRPAADTFAGAAVSGGVLYVADTAGVLRRFDARTGAPRGARALPGRRPEQLAVVGGAIYLRAVDRSGRSRLARLGLDGSRRWEVVLPPDEGFERFTVAAGLVLVTSGPKCHDLCTGHHLRAYRTRTGTLAWTGAVDGDADGGATVVGGLAVQSAYGPAPGGGGDSLLFAYDLGTGVRRWVRVGPGFDRAGWRGTLLAAGSGVGGAPGALCAFTPSTAAVRWCRPAGADEWYDGISAGGGDLFGYGLPGTVRRFDPATGAPGWATPLALAGFQYNAIKAPLVSGGGVVYAVVAHGNFTPQSEFTEVVALRTADGRILRRLRLTGYEDTTVEPMLVSGRLVLVGDRSVRGFSGTAS